jgi:glyoxylase-like metal-dependent hydrolase (beta-lactamase superfamily II)
VADIDKKPTRGGLVHPWYLRLLPSYELKSTCFAINFTQGSVGRDSVRAEKKPERICERVFQVGGPDMTSGQDCCVYLVDGGGELALIDAGCGPSYKSLVANIIRLGFEPEDLRWVILTHCHIDHAGGAGRFRTDFGARLIARSEDAVPMEKGDRLMTGAFLYGVEFEPLRIDRQLSLEQEEVEVGDLTLEALFTPGHSPGSMSVYLDIADLRVLFGQDIHGPFHPDFGSDIGEWRSSMEKLLALDADILCEGHFGIYSPAGAVRSYIEGYLDSFSR